MDVLVPEAMVRLIMMKTGLDYNQVCWPIFTLARAFQTIQCRLIEYQHCIKVSILVVSYIPGIIFEKMQKMKIEALIQRQWT